LINFEARHDAKIVEGNPSVKGSLRALDLCYVDKINKINFKITQKIMINYPFSKDFYKNYIFKF